MFRSSWNSSESNITRAISSKSHLFVAIWLWGESPKVLLDTAQKLLGVGGCNFVTLSVNK